jgi:hypothetical protein
MTSIERERIIALTRGGETDLVELKREWWDFDSKIGKATFAKDVLAMANTLSPGESGFIIIGIEDKKAGGAVVGVAVSPSQETAAQVLNTYTNPVPRIKLEEVILNEKRIVVLEVVWGESHPYYATRDVESVLSSDVVYTRRAGTVGRLKPAEFESLIRAKDARLGKISERTPLSVGFVELPTAGSADRISYRIANNTEEPVINISASIDLIWLCAPKLTCRMSQLSNLTLRPGETRESDFQISNASFFNEATRRFERASLSSQVFDARLCVRYRGRDGFLHEIVCETSIWS